MEIPAPTPVVGVENPKTASVVVCFAKSNCCTKATVDDTEVEVGLVTTGDKGSPMASTAAKTARCCVIL